MEVICLSLSHKTADVAMRERFAFAQHEMGSCSGELARRPELGEAMILSTCNRVELYAAAPERAEGFACIEAFLSSRAALEPEDRKFFYRKHGAGAVRHLFRVVSGLESMVFGETEILGQVKKAYGAAAACGATARHLNKLFQRAFNVAKEVRTKTNITRGPVSVGSVAADLAEKILGCLGNCRAMILGAGETSELTARALMSRGAHGVFVANRSFERARALAYDTHGEAIGFEQWHEHLDDIDILISSTSAPHLIVTPEKLGQAMCRRRNRPVFVIDLAVPRDIDPAVNDIDGVIDALRGIAARSMAVRQQESAECERVIERHVGRILRLARQRPFRPHAERDCSQLATTSEATHPTTTIESSGTLSFHRNYGALAVWTEKGANDPVVGSPDHHYAPQKNSRFLKCRSMNA